MLYLPRPELVSVNIPFSGFYESQWSQLVDREAEQYLEYVEESGSSTVAEKLCAKRGDLGELLFEHTQYSVAYANIAKDYAEAYFWWLGESLGFPVTVIETMMSNEPDTPGYNWVHRAATMPVAWEWEEMVSPRQYNFSTDRLFAKIDAVVLRELFRQLMLVDNSWALDGAVKAMFTSYDGFCSWYDNDPAALKAKPLEEWDHNELQVLLVAWGRVQHGPHERTEDELYEGLAWDGYTYFDNAVDWVGLEASCRYRVLDLLDDEDLPEVWRHQLEHPRCTDTLELPL